MRSNMIKPMKSLFTGSFLRLTLYYVIAIYVISLLVKLIFDYPDPVNLKKMFIEKTSLGLYLGSFHWFIWFSKSKTRIQRLVISIIIIVIFAFVYVVVKRII